MAETWADLTAMEGQDEAIDNAPQPEADANDDKVDDALRPRRNRAATLNDDTIDEGNIDEPPKPKRGRGRPKKDEEGFKENYNVIQMRKELDDLRTENTKLEDLLKVFTSRNEDIEKDLEQTRASLVEKEQDYIELLEQFSSHEESSLSAQSTKPVGLVFYDDITEQIATKLPSTIKWNKIKKSLSDIDESDGYSEVDIVLLLTGASEIINGVSAFQQHQVLKQQLSTIGAHCAVYATSLPPNNKARIQMDLFNHKFSNMTGDGSNVNLIKLKFLGSKLDLVNFDGFTPNSKCLSLFEIALQGIKAPSTIKDKANDPSKSTKSDDFNVTAVVPVKSELVGRIIGKGGSVIRKIIEDCQVKISFGNWKERTSEAREEDPECFTGVLIRGRIGNVKRAIDWVSDIIKSGKNK